MRDSDVRRSDGGEWTSQHPAISPMDKNSSPSAKSETEVCWLDADGSCGFIGSVRVGARYGVYPYLAPIWVAANDGADAPVKSGLRDDAGEYHPRTCVDGDVRSIRH